MATNYTPSSAKKKTKKKLIKGHARYNYVKSGAAGKEQVKKFEKIKKKEEKEEADITHVGDKAYKEGDDLPENVEGIDVSGPDVPVDMENTKKEIKAYAEEKGIKLDSKAKKRVLLDTIAGALS